MTDATTGCTAGTDGDDGYRPGAGPESTAAATKGAMTHPVASPGAGTNTVAGTATATEIKARDLNGTGAGKGPGQGGGPRPKVEATDLEPDSAVDAGAGDPFDRDDLPTPRGATRTLLVSLLGPLRGRVVVAALFLLIQQAAVQAAHCSSRTRSTAACRRSGTRTTDR